MKKMRRRRKLQWRTVTERMKRIKKTTAQRYKLYTKAWSKAMAV